jgi:pimeloyl-ACP methyl ester carboxylesterase
MRLPSRRNILLGAGAASALASAAAPSLGFAMTPRLKVSPATALQDVPLRIRLTGVTPSARVMLIAAMRNRDGALWHARATFSADAAGTVDPARDAPLNGSYAGVAPMGLVWSMAPDPTAPSFGPMRVRDPITIRFNATTPEGATFATAEAQRLPAAPDVAFRPLDDATGLRGAWWLPAAAPKAAMIVLGGSGGGADHARAALYASHGYAALALAYFGVPGLPRGLVNIPLEYVGRAIDHALAEIKPPKDIVIVEGISRGGELALLAGATFPKVRAVLGVMASGLVMGGFGPPSPGAAHPRAAWLLDGKPVPDLFEGNPMVDWSTSKTETSLVPGYLAAMRHAPSVERATIAVERINGPVMLVSGKDDRLAPRVELAEIARRRLVQYRHRWPVAHLVYDDCGHTIAPPYIPATVDSFVHPVSKDVTALGGTTPGRAHANADWWPKALAFLEAAARAPAKARP